VLLGIHLVLFFWNVLEMLLVISISVVLGYGEVVTL
jgi:hypothetical protein